MFRLSFFSVWCFSILTCCLLFAVRCRTTAPVSLQPMGVPVSPEDNPMTMEKIAFGKELFFDKRLSKDHSISCAVCHKPFLAFTDGLQFSEGIGDRKSSRNASTIVNVAFQPYFMFDGVIETLEQQALVPIQDHNEMGMTLKEVVERLAADSSYREKARKIFNREIDPYVITRALAAFQRYLISDNSPFDQYYYGNNKNAISASAKRGWVLFSETLSCTNCHSAPAFTNFKPENNGSSSTYIADPGRFRATGDSSDYGKFKIPSLRNIELTAPYMHDGSLATLMDVIHHYEKGGNRHFNQHPSIKPFQLSKREKADLIAFLRSLTDESYFEKLRSIN